MIEITDPARQLIRSAWRRGRVLVVAAPWRGYAGTAALVARWVRASDAAELADHVQVGDGDWIYFRSDLVQLVRRRRVLLDFHTILGLWPGIAVRDLGPVPVRHDRGRRRPRAGGSG